MSPFYFGLLSHLMEELASKYDFDVEDAFILQELSRFFMKQELKEIEVSDGKKSKNMYYIDGIFSEIRF